MARRTRAKRKVVEVMAPTEAQMARDVFKLERQTERGQVGGEVYRKVRQLEHLLSADIITPDESKALSVYRMYADIAERSLTKDSLDKALPRGSGDGTIPPSILNARRMAGIYEAAAGSLCDIMRAVIWEDRSLSQWAIDQAGGIEDCKIKDGVRVCRIKPHQKAFAIAKLEIRMAARRVLAEINA